MNRPAPRLHLMCRAAVTPGSNIRRSERPRAERRSAARHLSCPAPTRRARRAVAARPAALRRPRSIGAWPTTLTLLIEPLPADDAVDDLDATFREVDAVRPGAARRRAVDAARRRHLRDDRRGRRARAGGAAAPRAAAQLGPHLRAARAEPAAVGGGDRPRASRRSRRPGEFALKLVLSRGVEHGPAPTAWLHVAPAADFSAARERGIRVVTLDRGYDTRHRRARAVAAARREDAVLRGEHGGAPRGEAARRRRRDLRHERRLRHGGPDVERHPAARRRLVDAGAVGRDPARHDPAEPVRAPRGIRSAHRVPRHPRRRARRPRMPRGSSRACGSPPASPRSTGAADAATTPTRRASSTTTC